MEKDLVYACLSGPTASYRIPSTITGTQLALTVPGYSSVLGMLSYAADREITPNDTRIGYRFSYQGRGMDKELVHRWGRSKRGSYSYSGTNPRNREVFYNIEMDLIIDNLEFLEILKSPNRPLTFGRSQDLATIKRVEQFTAKPTDKGKIWGTLLPVKIGEDIPADGIFYNLPEYFSYFDRKVRRPRNIRTFLALSQYISEVSYDNLYQVQESDLQYPVFYLHEWQSM